MTSDNPLPAPADDHGGVRHSRSAPQLGRFHAASAPKTLQESIQQLTLDVDREEFSVNPQPPDSDHSPQTSAPQSPNSSAATSESSCESVADESDDELPLSVPCQYVEPVGVDKSRLFPPSEAYSRSRPLLPGSQTPRNRSVSPGAFPQQRFRREPSKATQEWEEQKRDGGAKNEAIDKLMALVGLEEVKRQVLAIRNKVEICKKQGADIKKERFNVIFQGNPGTGKTTVARIYAEFLRSVGVLDSADVKETSGAKLAFKGPHGAKRIIKKLVRYGEGGVLFVDEAYQLVAPYAAGAGRQALDIILTEMENNIGKLVVIFVGYKDDMASFFEHNPGLASRIPYCFHFADFSDEQLWTILRDNFKAKYGRKLRIEDGMKGLYTHVAIRRLGRSRNNRGFGNARAVENLLARISERQAVRVKDEQRRGESPNPHFFKKEDLIGKDPTEAKLQSSAWAELQKLIGLDSVKRSVEHLIGIMERNYQRELDELKPLQMTLNQVFVGSPGTGKTTVAKLYGEILADIGLLSKGEGKYVVLKNPSDFIGECLGKSEAKTRGILASTTGKVLIIDEAYMLDAGDSSKQQDSFKTGVIDTLVAEVQGVPGEDRCIILLGYEDKLEELFENANPGLSRRFPIKNPFRFEDFNLDQLEQILLLKLDEQELGATDEALDVAREILGRALMRPKFSNGGEVESCLTTAKYNHEARQAKLPRAERSNYAVFEPEDFDPDYRRAQDSVGNCRRMLEGLVDERIIRRLEACQESWRLAKNYGLDPRELVPTNFIFKGAPGTGKTTAARSMGKVFYDMGFLSTDEVIECSATDLIGQYVGQTAPKAKKQLERALGKVLFIDEAYRLADGQFAMEAINELINFMTQPKHLGRVIIILAGYVVDINHLLSARPALSGHFPEEIMFENLKPEDCITLLKRELELKRIRAPFLENPTSEGYKRLRRGFRALRLIPSWSNARDIKTLANRMTIMSLASPKRQGESLLLSQTVAEQCVRQMIKMQSERCTNKVYNAGMPQLAMDAPQAQQPEVATPPPPTAKNVAVDSTPPEAEPSASLGTMNGHTAQVCAVQRDVTSLSDDEDDSDAVDGSGIRVSEPVASSEVMDRLAERREADERESAVRDARINDLKRQLDHCTNREARAVLEKELEGYEAEQRELYNVQARLQAMGRCIAGYAWRRDGDGWRCEGGTHYIGNSELA